jgi:hypothetical protein
MTRELDEEEDRKTNGGEADGSTPPGGDDLESALASHEQAVDRAAREVARLTSAIRTWKKACQTGHMANRKRYAENCVKFLEEAESAIRAAADGWTFDVQSYLEGSGWREEVEGEARGRYGLRVHRNEAARQLISSPVAVSALPGRAILRIGRASWPAIRPSAVAAELKRLHDRVSDANSQEFLESLYAACMRQVREGTARRASGMVYVKLRDAYELFCLAPGYRRENPPQVFGEALYALHHSDSVRTTRAGKKFEWEWPTGKPKERDIFRVVAGDGTTVSYYGIWVEE